MDMQNVNPLLLTSGIRNVLYRGDSGYLGFVSRLSIDSFQLGSPLLWHCRVYYSLFTIYKVAQLEELRGTEARHSVIYGILLCLSPLFKID